MDFTNFDANSSTNGLPRRETHVFYYFACNSPKAAIALTTRAESILISLNCGASRLFFFPTPHWYAILLNFYLDAHCTCTIQLAKGCWFGTSILRFFCYSHSPNSIAVPLTNHTCHQSSARMHCHKPHTQTLISRSVDDFAWSSPKSMSSSSSRRKPCQRQHCFFPGLYIYSI